MLYLFSFLVFYTLTSYLQVYHTLRDCVTSFRSRPHPKLPYTLLPVSATNPLRPRFTLSPYLIPLKPQLPSWLLTEHDSLWTALVINNSPVVRSVSPAAGHPHVPHWCVREATLCFFTSSVSCFGLRGGIRTFHLFVSVAGTEVPSDVATFALPNEFCPRSLHNFVRKLKNRWRIGLPYFNIRTTQNRSILVGKAHRTRGNSWSGERVSRKRATYCRCESRLPLWQPGLTRCLCR